MGSGYRNESRELRREATWTIWNWLPVVALCIMLVLGLAWFFQGNDFFMYKVFAPKYQNAQHEVFKNSQPYIDGKVTDLQDYMLAYYKADPEHKAALRTVIIRESAHIDEKYLPSDLRAFISKVKSEGAGTSPINLN